MIAIRFNDLFERFTIEKNQYNVFGIREIVKAMIKNKYAVIDNSQMIVFDEILFKFLLDVYNSWYNYFDINYNQKNDLSIFFQIVILAKKQKEGIKFLALFCPGYTKTGYKNYLGYTTIWKLEELQKISDLLNSFGIKNEITCYYSDVFLENYDSDSNPNWGDELNFNRSLFHEECQKYPNLIGKNLSDLNLFSKKDDIIGYINEDIIENLSSRVYKVFKKANEEFYKKMGFSEKQIRFRNDKLITMYTLFSRYINKLNNSIFLPMENMYNRQIVFADNGTCTMYLKLKKE